MNVSRYIRGKIGGVKRAYRVVAEDRLTRKRMRLAYDPKKPVPISLQQELTSNNPKLTELRKRYDSLDIPASVHSQWGERAQGTINTNLAYFRGDSPYVWHYRKGEEITYLKYFIFLKYVESVDSEKLLGILVEDGDFGCWHYEYPDYPMVSRDLLDSILEISFLQRNLDIFSLSSINVLDIGAGYGRFAHRFSSALASTKNYICVDAIPESTFLCDYYLNYRGLDNTCKAVPLDDVDAGELTKYSFDLAVNIHSFSECKLQAVQWWVDKVSALEIPYLFIVPNEEEGFLTNEGDGARKDYLQLIIDAGYSLKKSEFVFGDKAVRDIVGVFDSFYLFERV
ncbi:putative sugar O-methyltransferase [Zhongshania aquimaris]|uniref:Sugar O-methyltransferase n=1 Tax=Zhongshania aquimaris TaxID=2857107 RepID=A0ABS6VN46_9GAMM|nr:putative sugar O-methyltransferase [Zhongshania aquimaris]